MSKSGETKTKTKNKGGRPSKFDEAITNNIELIKKYYRFGLTDKQVAELIGISEATLNNYKKDERFLESLKKEKLFADVEVIASLYKRATGYEYDEVYQEGSPSKDDKDKITIKTIKKTRKHIAADPTSIIYWLRNRQGWKDKTVEGYENEKETIPEFDKMSDADLDKYIKETK